MSIYVPDSLKAEMDKLGDDRVNWSSAAQEAFETELRKHQWPKEASMEQVVDRLRASKAEYVKREAGEGHRHGREWAALNASYQLLRKLAELNLDDFDDELEQVVDRHLNDGNLPETFEDRFFFDGTRDRPSDEYVRAYVEGAQSVWEEVEDKL